MNNTANRLGRVARGAVWSGCFVACFALASSSAAQTPDWDNVEWVPHRIYQAVDPSSYTGGFPIRLRGVVLNNTEDLWDPTAAYDPDYDPDLDAFELGGQAEFYLQAVDLPGETWDDGDFGGTACWMGQNYGNLPWFGEPEYSYQDQAWYDELDRLQLWREGTPVSPLVRAGNLVEIRARAGLEYSGKMNVNEQHDRHPDNDFEVVILDPDYGLPEPARISLGDIQDGANEPIFDSTRLTGGERYQSTLVEIGNVRFLETSGWSTDSDLTLGDDSGRTLNVHLGRHPSFDNQPMPQGYFNVRGILDQNSRSGTGGYQLLAMRAADFAPSSIPEPGSVAMLLAGGACLLCFAGRMRRQRIY